MPSATLNRDARFLQAIFKKESLKNIAKQTGFTKRERAITADRIFPALLSALGDGKIESVANLASAFNRSDLEQQVSYKCFHSRLDRPEFPILAERVLGCCVIALKRKMLGALKNGIFSKFKDILIQDGSSLSLRNNLAKIFPGVFTAHSPAAAGIHLCMSVFHDNIENVQIGPYSDSERDYLPSPESLKGKLIMLDRGYDDKQYMREVHDHGGYFLIRMKTNHDPIVSKIRVKGKRLRSLEGNHLSYIIDRLPKKKIADLDIELFDKGAGPLDRQGHATKPPL